MLPLLKHEPMTHVPFRNSGKSEFYVGTEPIVIHACVERPKRELQRSKTGAPRLSNLFDNGPERNLRHN
jgi:hypothetical protein